jgi:CDP-2,3-bis-(O-geranylgeranyl)-sn-glycerol synthase
MSEFTIANILAVMGMAFWVMIPSFLPNSSAVIFGGGTPMDFGKSMKDGRRILGKGKTWRGFFGGTFAGTVIGLIQLAIAYNFDPDEFWGFGPLPKAVLVIFILALGAMFGDALGSFIKRRYNKDSGAPVPGLDQYDFIIGSWLLIIILQFGWFYEHFIEGVNIFALIFILVLTPLLHRTVNIIGYKMGKKDVPW